MAFMDMSRTILLPYLGGIYLTSTDPDESEFWDELGVCLQAERSHRIKLELALSVPCTCLEGVPPH
jgi:hypothetical protein